MAIRELWRHRREEDIWVVELEGAYVSACARPFDAGEISDGLLQTIEFDEREAPWLRRHRDRFEPRERPAAEIWPT